MLLEIPFILAMFRHKVRATAISCQEKYLMPLPRIRASALIFKSSFLASTEDSVAVMRNQVDISSKMESFN